MSKKSFEENLFELLKSEGKFLDQDGDVLIDRVIDSAYKTDRKLIELLLDNTEIKNKFFSEIKKHWVFNINDFVMFIQDKHFLNDSYTQYKNKIGLNIGGKFMNERREVALVWPFKDCVLEGGMSKEDEKKKEIFFNEILAQDEIDKLYAPKVLTNWKRHTKNGEEDVEGLKRDESGTIKENLLIKGNNLLALHTLKEQFRGKVKLIYIDPPYNTGNDSFSYNDNFNHSTWLTFMKNRLEVARDLLSSDGSIYVNIDQKEAHYLKILLDQVFGREFFQNEIIWTYTGGTDRLKGFNRKHDNIFFYSKTQQYLFNNVYEAFSDATIKRFNKVDKGGRRYKENKLADAEAQLIGRGARYAPFVIDGYNEKYKRKFDYDLDHELRILEELHYHSHNESRYISEITKALVDQGMLDEKVKEVEIKLKSEFKNKRFYKSGIVWRNEKIKTDFSKKKILQDLPSRKQNILYHVSSGKGDETSIFAKDKNILKQQIVDKKQDIKLSDIETHVILSAMQKNDFYSFSHLQYYFPELTSQNDFAKDNKYLAGFGITLEGATSDLKNLNNHDLFQAVLKLLNTIEHEVTKGVAEFQGTEEFIPANFSEIFSDKKIKVKIGSEQEKDKWDYLADKDWYVFDSLHGTPEEQAFVELVERMIGDLREKYQEIYLVRNERVLKIYNFDDGQAFEPDYLLFMNNKNEKSLTYQLFIEPKGNHLIPHDKWKDQFLKEITKRGKKGKSFEYSNKKYKILGVPFYNKQNENEFKDNLLDTLDY